MLLWYTQANIRRRTVIVDLALGPFTLPTFQVLAHRLPKWKLCTHKSASVCSARGVKEGMQMGIEFAYSGKISEMLQRNSWTCRNHVNNAGQNEARRGGVSIIGQFSQFRDQGA